MKYFISLVFTILLFCCGFATAKTANNARNYLLNKTQCTEESQKKIELTIAKLVGIGKHGRAFPETFGEIKGFCRDTNRMITQVESFFTSCYKKQMIDLALIPIYSSRNVMKKYCTAQRKSKPVVDLLKVTPCVNKHVRLQIPCIDQFIQQTKSLMYIPEDDLKIPHTCCNYLDLLKCFDNYLENVACARAHKEGILDLIRGTISGLTDLMCSEYGEETDKCDKLAPAKPKQKNKRNYVTFAFVLTDVLESIKGFGSGSWFVQEGAKRVSERVTSAWSSFTDYVKSLG